MTAIVNSDGIVIRTLTCLPELIHLNTPDGCVAVDDPPEQNMIYSNGEWVRMPPRPTLYHEFNVKLWLWQDTRSLEQLKVHTWASLKEQRDNIEYGGFYYLGNLYDSDTASQTRIMAATLSGLPQTWVTKDNQEVELSASDMQGLYQAMQQHSSELHLRGRVAREAINNASTVDEVGAVVL